MYKDKHICAVILARMHSTRLKDKMLLRFGESTVVETVIDRMRHSALIDSYVLATSTNPRDEVFGKIAQKKGIDFFRGSENDVVSRILNAARSSNSKTDIAVRVCSDNPLIMPPIVDEGIMSLIDEGADVLTPFRFNTYPFGYSAVVMTMNALKKIDKEAKEEKYREHVENFCFDYPDRFKVLYAKAPESMRLPQLRMTLDYEEDYDRLKDLYAMIKRVPISEQPRRLVEEYRKKVKI